jgi:hypothetical protein
MVSLEECKQGLLARIPAFARRVQPIYRLLGWKWTHAPHDRVPTVRDIVGVLNSLAHDIVPSNVTSVSTGGVGIQVSGLGGESPTLRMFFEVVDYSEPKRRKCAKKMRSKPR